MNLYNQTFEVTRFSSPSVINPIGGYYKDNATIIGQCDGLYGEDMVKVEYESDGRKLDCSISQFLKSVTCNE